MRISRSGDFRLGGVGEEAYELSQQNVRMYPASLVAEAEITE